MAYDGTPFSSFVESTPSSASVAAPAPDAHRAAEATPQPAADAQADDQNTRPPEKRPGVEGHDAAKAARAAPSAKDHGQLGDGLTPELLAHREALRQEFPFQDPQKAYGPDVGLEASADAAGLVGKEREAELAEQRRMLWDFQLNSSEAKEIVSMVDKYASSPPDEKTSAQWAQESWAALVRQFGGANEASARLADAQKLIARNPRVKAMLQQTGLGNNPRIIAKAVALARSEKAKGRLK